jgi:GT2 family glycosyltransferase
MPGTARLALSANRGFTGGMNAGVAWALAEGFDFLWLLNDDVRVTNDAHRQLLERAARDGPGVWTPQLIDAVGRVGHVGGQVSLDGSALTLCDADAFEGLSTGIRWLSGTALFLSASAARTVGAFDDRYFAYWEDVDWCLRAQQLGVRLSVHQAAMVRHDQKDTLAARGHQRYFLTARNEFAFARKHVARDAWEQVLPRIAARQLRLAAWLDRRGAAGAARAVLAGGLSGLRGRIGIPTHAWISTSLADEWLSHALTLAQRLERAGATCMMADDARASAVR